MDIDGFHVSSTLVPTDNGLDFEEQRTKAAAAETPKGPTIRVVDDHPNDSPSDDEAAEARDRLDKQQQSEMRATKLQELQQQCENRIASRSEFLARQQEAREKLEESKRHSSRSSAIKSLENDTTITVLRPRANVFQTKRPPPTEKQDDQSLVNKRPRVPATNNNNDQSVQDQEQHLVTIQPTVQSNDSSKATSSLIIDDYDSEDE